jgi:hypothetical protein
VIKVWKCRRSRKCVSIHPTFLIPRKQYTFSVLYAVLRLYLVQGLGLGESVAGVFAGKVSPSYQVVQHWIHGMKRGAAVWVGLLQGETGATPSGWPTAAPGRPVELVHLMVLLDRYLAGASSVGEREALHGRLYNRYRGSPFSPCREQ